MNAAYTKTQERFKTDSALMKEILGTSDEKVNEITETLSLAVEAFNTDIRVTQNMIYNDDTDDAGKANDDPDFTGVKAMENLTVYAKWSKDC
jgi:hypothetical protein